MLSRLGLTIAIGGLSLVAGCAGPIQSDYDTARERVDAYIGQHPGLAPETRKAMQWFELRNGMTMDEAVATRGRPVIVRRFRNGQQYWYFGCSFPNLCTPRAYPRFPTTPDEIYQSRALFENGRVVSWQD